MRNRFNTFLKKIALITVLSFFLVFVFSFSNIAHAGFFSDLTFAVKEFKNKLIGDNVQFISQEFNEFNFGFNQTLSAIGSDLTASIVSPFAKAVDKFSQWNDAVESKLGNAYLKTISYIIPGYSVEILNQQSTQVYRLPETQETIIKEIVRETIIKTPPTEKIIKQEIQKITETEKITEVTKVTETVKPADLTLLRQDFAGQASRITGVESMLANVRTADNYVSSPRMFNESGNLTFTARGGGSIFLSADNGLQLSGGQIILDAIGAVNTTPYITVKDILNLDNTNIRQTGSSLTNTLAGHLTVNSNTTLGDASTDTLTINSNINSNFIPSTTNTYDLGSSTNQWKSLYVSGSTIYLNGTAISNNSGTLTWAGSGGIQSTTGTTTISNLAVTATTTFNGVPYGWPSSDGTSGYVLSTNGSGILSWSTTAIAGGWTDDGTSVRLTTSTDSIGIGTTTPAAKLHALSTTEQLRLGYDSANYVPFTINSGGDLTVAPTGSDFNITGGLTTTGSATMDTLRLTNSLAIAYGGTAATNATDARSNLGLAIGTNVQSYSSRLADIAALATTDSNFIVGNGSTWVAETGTTARTSMGLGTGDSPTFTGLTLSGLTNGSILFSTSSGIISQSNSGLFWDNVNSRLGIGTTTPAAKLHALATTEQLRLGYDNTNYASFTINSGGDLTIAPTGSDFNITGGLTTTGSATMDTLRLTNSLAIAYGGTAATNATDARSNLGLAIGTNVQAYDAELAAIAGLASSADIMTYFTGSGTAATSSLTSFGRSLIDDANSSTARTTMGLAIGTDVQSYSSRLADIAALATTDSNFIVANGSTWVAETGATARTSMGLGTGDSPTLTGLTLSGLTNGSLLFATSSGVISQSNSSLFWDNVNNRLGIGTSTPARKLSVVDASNPQMRLTSDISTVYTDFSVAASTGDLTVSLYPSSSANDIILNMPSGSTGANLWICEGDACPTVSFTGGGNLFVEGDIKYATSSRKTYRSIILTAAGAITPTTSGAAKTQVDGTNHSYYVLDFDAAADEAAYWQWTMPDSYDDGVISVTYYWEAGATSGDTIWCFQAKGLSANNTEDIDTALSTAICETDTAQGNANDLASITESNATSSFTVGEYAIFKVFRDANDAADTMTGDARLVKVKIEYGVSQESD